MTTTTRPLTPHQLQLVQRFGLDAAAIAAHLTAENRYHATGHGYRDPNGFAVRTVAAFRAADDATVARAQQVLDEQGVFLGTEAYTAALKARTPR